MVGINPGSIKTQKHQKNLNKNSKQTNTNMPDSSTRPMRFCYADPPYLGQGRRLYGKSHPCASEWDDPARHHQLVRDLCEKFPDGWAMSLSSPSLKAILPACPDDCRVAAWVKPFAVFKPGVTVAYAWEPVIFRGGRKRPRTMPTIRDWVSQSITLKKGCVGAKPEQFCMWLFDLLNMEPQDDFVDMFPGSGGVKSAWDEFCLRKSFPQVPATEPAIDSCSTMM